MKHVIAFLFVLVTLAGCAGSPLQPFEAPEVTLVNITPQDMTLFEQRFDVRLRVRNPNNAALPMTGMKFDLALNGQKFAHGMSSNDLRLPALGEDTLNVAVTTTALDWLKQLNTMKTASEGFSYQIDGVVFLGGMSSLLGGIDKQGFKNGIPFSHGGTLPGASN